MSYTATVGMQWLAFVASKPEGVTVAEARKHFGLEALGGLIINIEAGAFALWWPSERQPRATRCQTQTQQAWLISVDANGSKVKSAGILPGQLFDLP